MTNNIYATLITKMSENISAALEAADMNLYRLANMHSAFDINARTMEIPVRRPNSQQLALYTKGILAPTIEIEFEKRRVTWQNPVGKLELSEKELKEALPSLKSNLIDGVVDKIKVKYDTLFLSALTGDVQSVGPTGIVTNNVFPTGAYPAGNVFTPGSKLDISVVSKLLEIADDSEWSPSDKKIFLVDAASMESFRNSTNMTIDHIGIKKLDEISNAIALYNATGFEFRGIYFIQIYSKYFEIPVVGERSLLYFNMNSMLAATGPLSYREVANEGNVYDYGVGFGGQFAAVRQHEKGVFKINVQI